MSEHEFEIKVTWIDPALKGQRFPATTATAGPDIVKWKICFPIALPMSMLIGPETEREE